MVSRRFRSGLLVIAASLAFAPIESAADFSTEWSRCVSTIRAHYYAAAAKKQQLNKLFAQYQEPATNAASRSDFTRIVNEMIKTIGDSHFELFSSDQQSFYMVDHILKNGTSLYPFTGAYFTEQKVGWSVEMVLNGTSSAKAGLRKNDVVLKANGLPFSPVIGLKKVDGTAHLEVLRAGKTLMVDVKVIQSDFVNMAAEATRTSCRTIDSGGKKIGYIKLWMMLGDSFLMNLINGVTVNLMDADAIVLDLRDGFGGYMDWYADVFFRPDVISERKGQSSTSKLRYGFSKPIAVLTNGGTRSAKEVLSYMMKSTKRGTLIGTRTAGKVLGCNQFRIADWAILQVPVVDIYIDGKRLEGVGVEPDIEVKTEFSPDGEDLVLKEALRILAAAP